MSSPLSAAARRALALAVLASAVVLCWVLAVSPLYGLARDRLTDIDTLAERVARAEAVVARRPSLERRLERAKADLAAGGGLWTGVSGAAVAAAMQDRLREAAIAAGGRVNSISEARETAERGFRRITLRFRISGTLETAVQVLAAIEHARPALFADSVSLAVPENAVDPKRPPPLDLDIEVSGYLEPPAS